jgi:hypothetical protein
LHSCLQHRSCDAEEFLHSASKTGTSVDRGSELLCGGSNLQALGANQAAATKLSSPQSPRIPAKILPRLIRKYRQYLRPIVSVLEDWLNHKCLLRPSFQTKR